MIYPKQDKEKPNPDLATVIRKSGECSQRYNRASKVGKAGG
jgi:hypothetical protein